MRKRTIRDLGTLLGVAVILALLVTVNIMWQLGGRRARAIAWREAVEKHQIADGVDLLNWDLLQETKGTKRKGATFSEELVPLDESVINVVGYMVPIDQFRKVSHFMLLPMPLNCYFCEAPPMRDIVLVELQEDKLVDLVEEPVLIGGQLILNEGPNPMFYYDVQTAVLGVAEKDGVLNKMIIDEEHKQHMMEKSIEEVMQDEDKEGTMLEGEGDLIEPDAS